MLLADRQAHPLVSAATYPVPDVSLAGRDYYRAVMAGYPGIYVSAPQVGDVNRQLFFGVAGPWLDRIRAQWSAAWWTSPCRRPSSATFYRALLSDVSQTADDTIVSLVRSDGEILVRYPAPQPQRRVGTAASFLAATRQNPEGGTYATRPEIDTGTVPRVFAYRRVPGFPLYVLVARSRTAIVAAWQRTLVGHLVFGVPLTPGAVGARLDGAGTHPARAARPGPRARRDRVAARGRGRAAALAAARGRPAR